MARYGLILSFLILAICCYCGCCVPLAAPDEERYIRKDFNRDLLDWYNNGVNQYPTAQLATLCRYPYFLDNSLVAPVHMRKRNSELINSLLSLPKNMNDAGK